MGAAVILHLITSSTLSLSQPLSEHTLDWMKREEISPSVIIPPISIYFIYQTDSLDIPSTHPSCDQHPLRLSLFEFGASEYFFYSFWLRRKRWMAPPRKVFWESIKSRLRQPALVARCVYIVV